MFESAHRRRDTLIFAVFVVLIVLLIRVVDLKSAWLAAALPWGLLALFWLLVALGARNDRRRERADRSSAPPTI